MSKIICIFAPAFIGAGAKPYIDSFSTFNKPTFVHILLKFLLFFRFDFVLLLKISQYEQQQQTTKCQ